MYFEEHLVEVQIDQSTRVFFTNLVDELPENISEVVDGEVVILEPDYEEGSYLKEMSSILLAPLTPAIGNANIRNSEKLVVRFFRGSTAIEFGCTFKEQTTVRGTPLLRLNYPTIGRENKNFRSFRVKACQSVDAKVRRKYSGTSAGNTIEYQISDISAQGMAVDLGDGEPDFKVGETIQFILRVEGINELEVCGTIRHITKARIRKGCKNLCGIQFDLETLSLASELEKVAAAIQRMSIRELSEKTAELESVHLL